MNEVRIQVRTAQPYAVHIGRGLGQAALAEIGPATRLVLTDRHVAAAQAPALSKIAETSAPLVLEPGEGSKSFARLERVLDHMVLAGLDRDSLLVAFGGGVVSDVGGLAAALYQRGIGWIACPTTLLAQVDASVGGKTAVNLSAGKNLAGAFHQPRAVFVDVDTLGSLPEEELASGFGEVVKSAWVGDPDLLTWIEENASALVARDPDALGQAIERCIRVKAAVVAGDEEEAGARRALNLGHTFAHGIESVAGFGTIPHGVAVGVGIDLALRASRDLGLLADNTWVDRNSELLKRLALPCSLAELRKRTSQPLEAALLKKAFEADKKKASGRTRWVLVQAPGNLDIDANVPSALLDRLLG